MADIEHFILPCKTVVFVPAAKRAMAACAMVPPRDWLLHTETHSIDMPRVDTREVTLTRVDTRVGTPLVVPQRK